MFIAYLNILRTYSFGLYFLCIFLALSGVESEENAAFATGYWHSCAILENDTVKCWGNNGWPSGGLLGLGDSSHRGDGPSEMGDNLPSVNLGTGRIARRRTRINECAGGR